MSLWHNPDWDISRATPTRPPTYPRTSPAVTFGVVGTLLFTVAACGAYLSFLLPIDWTQFTVEWQDISELVARVVFLAMAGNLANTLAEALRVQSEKHRRTAEQLAEAN